MRSRSAVLILLAVGFFRISIPLLAHHGNATYDYEKTLTIKGTVTAWVFANPHSLKKPDRGSQRTSVPSRHIWKLGDRIRVRAERIDPIRRRPPRRIRASVLSS